MADYFTTPKKNWVPSDGIGDEDLNRIEANIDATRYGARRGLTGFGFRVDNTGGTGYDGSIVVFAGSGFSNNGVPFYKSAAHIKNLNTWAAGNGAAYGGMASAVTVAANTWYYIFIITNPTDGTTEVIFDDNTSGSNISDASYTEKRCVGAFKTRAAGDQGSFDLCEMYSTDGQNVVINPDSMFTWRHLTFTNSGGINDAYQTITLQETSPAEGYALPGWDVMAQLNLEFTPHASATTNGIGLLSTYAGVFTTPGQLSGSPSYSGELVFRQNNQSVVKTYDFPFLVNSSGQLKLAMYEAVALGGAAKIAVRGYHYDRWAI